ncbi:MAG: Ribonuclease H [Candidatus Gottesmanbacteria bacterium GW2011_GWB1_43_11]|uniref:Ribonuclease H n=1 Tax=Candidatus Gottesmanbacteria bacterium GW2011_GWB1_43_11 TaxID=1618446 RepID=A0A0G1CML9_9BACT|nr:MAG: Ribonuclease H [Candidatus Gottesmanbacteria bacterium GW2011_GWA2_42_16]KKS55848.1 MAG: Ribonuclease H [Candidatus Gottesmanbacteria bacterium GW2011_GWA1_42_26]KKS81249.1 MAG: Ribonuclease H [Candidatus Gottesmanbacteria bacterium GW2011_GWC1_43_10]KKS86769.1 MAG: Ribonuclease H [Candidatus Gottesmanbacteria bacterium GW2011_GWB1_43_11]OGG09839.1 MAG: hypothetical protein A2699_00550 [Candidatus Gottesmanbacteria bacterium RIFCSPHIGHO2_01_FULL_43_15]OGG27932.1 MAG: hypothetical prote
MPNFLRLNIFCDGGARGNPGPAAVGVVIQNATGEIIAKLGQVIGETTNNVAEYRAVIAAFKLLRKQNLTAQQLNFYLDSQVVQKQLAGLYKIKAAHLRELLQQVRIAEREFAGKIIYSQIPRKKNFQADQLVNIALDKQQLA